MELRHACARARCAAGYKPKAVIVDFLFVDPRPDDTLKDLVEEIARYKKAGMALYSKAARICPTARSRCVPKSRRPE